MKDRDEKTIEPNQTELSQEEFSLVEFIIKNPFASNRDLEKITGMNRMRIARIKNRPHVAEKIQEFTTSNIERFIDIQEKALMKAEELIDSPDHQIAWNASKPFIESLKSNKIEVDGKVEVIPPISLKFSDEQ